MNMSSILRGCVEPPVGIPTQRSIRRTPLGTVAFSDCRKGHDMMRHDCQHNRPVFRSRTHVPHHLVIGTRFSTIVYKTTLMVETNEKHNVPDETKQISAYIIDIAKHNQSIRLFMLSPLNSNHGQDCIPSVRMDSNIWSIVCGD